MTLFGIVTLVRLIQFQNVLVPILVTPTPMVADVIPLHPAKTLLPISVTLFGIVTLVKPLQ